MKQQANFDTTYCINDKCDKKCWRHRSNFEFDEKENYWYQDYCMDFLEREHKGEVK